MSKSDDDIPLVGKVAGILFVSVAGLIILVFLFGILRHLIQWAAG